MVIYIFFYVLCPGKPQVIGSAQPVVALVGESAILPSYLDPPEDASEITIEWSRPDLTPKYIYLLRDGREISDLKNPWFRGRTELFTEELKTGNISLKLSRVTLTDGGHYRCFLPSKDKEADLQLIVGMVSNPLIILIGTKDRRVVLQCESGGWYPEPEVEWLDSEGHVLSAGPTETVRDPDDIFTVRRNVTVYETDTNRFTCRVQQQHINQTRELHIFIPGGFFGCSGCSLILGLETVLEIFLGMVLCIVVLMGGDY
ncbi:butyrophilin subfamily 2 member A2-like [Aplochiton taeniatus]